MYVIVSFLSSLRRPCSFLGFAIVRIIFVDWFEVAPRPLSFAGHGDLEQLHPLFNVLAVCPPYCRCSQTSLRNTIAITIKSTKIRRFIIPSWGPALNRVVCDCCAIFWPPAWLLFRCELRDSNPNRPWNCVNCYHYSWFGLANSNFSLQLTRKRDVSRRLSTYNT